MRTSTVEKTTGRQSSSNVLKNQRDWGRMICGEFFWKEWSQRFLTHFPASLLDLWLLRYLNLKFLAKSRKITKIMPQIASRSFLRSPSDPHQIKHQFKIFEKNLIFDLAYLHCYWSKIHVRKCVRKLRNGKINFSKKNYFFLTSLWFLLQLSTQFYPLRAPLAI